MCNSDTVQPITIGALRLHAKLELHKHRVDVNGPASISFLRLASHPSKSSFASEFSPSIPLFNCCTSPAPIRIRERCANGE